MTNVIIPHPILEHDAFKPYPEGSKKADFNYRLTRAWGLSEDTFNTLLYN